MEKSSKDMLFQLPPRYCLHHWCAFFLKSNEISLESLAMDIYTSEQDSFPTEGTCGTHVTNPPLPQANHRMLYDAQAQFALSLYPFSKMVGIRGVEFSKFIVFHRHHLFKFDRVLQTK